MRAFPVWALGIGVAFASGCKPKVKCDKMCRRISLDCRTHTLRLVYAVPAHLVVQALKIADAKAGRRMCSVVCKEFAKKACEREVRKANKCINRKSCRDFSLCLRDALRAAGKLDRLQELMRRALELRLRHPTTGQRGYR